MKILGLVSHRYDRYLEKLGHPINKYVRKVTEEKYMTFKSKHNYLEHIISHNTNQLSLILIPFEMC